MNETNLSTLSTSRPHLKYVDGLRAFAALIVIANHTWQQIYWTSAPAQSWLRALSPLFDLGHYAVVAFIVLSGYCLMRPVLQSGSLRGGAWAFYKSRALRILPAYYAALVLTLVLIATVIGQKHNVMYDISLPVSMAGVVSHFLLIHNLWPPPFFSSGGNTQIASVFWTIALEWQIYFCFPIVVWLWKRLGIWLTLAVGGSVVFALHYLTVSRQTAWLDWQGFNFPFYAYFLVGVFAAYIVFSVSGERIYALNWQFAAWALIAAFCLVELRYMIAHQGPSLFKMELLTSLMTLAVLVAASKGGLKGLSWEPLEQAGSYAYSIYLLHLPILAVLTDLVIVPMRRTVPAPVQLGILLASGVGLTLFCAQKFSRVFEDKKRLAYYWARLMRVGNDNAITP